ncbi:hypothetical protein [Lachnoclostridium phytofermentans]|uniref:hypothetical protein n=1 Tax=Lachnoclostridium phytofermentans TaxID=66219 RepID=UPI0004979CF9|nr:hypothetical protein [Lachnoclostridium phytofermentans]
MRKVIISVGLTLFLLGLFGCKMKESKKEVTGNQSINKDALKNEPISFSDGAFNEEDIIHLFKLSQIEVEKYLGTDYIEDWVGVDGNIMYRYEKNDISIEYNGDSIWYINCGPNVSIYKVKEGMKFEEVKEYLGDEEVRSWSREEDPDTIFYELVYMIENMKIEFTSLYPDIPNA